jgi:FKBP-type peptidyl-prolyl cis-trans isomerase (trigger factor)
MTYKEFEKEAKKNIKENMKTELIFEYVAEKKDIKFDEKGYKKFIKTLKTQNGLKTTTELYETFAPNAKAGKEYMHKMYVCTKAIEYCQKHAVVTVKPAEAATE